MKFSGQIQTIISRGKGEQNIWIKYKTSLVGLMVSEILVFILTDTNI